MRLSTILLLSLMIITPSALLPQAPQQDVPQAIGAARVALHNARNNLAVAGGEWGGHKALAVQHIDAALAELQEAAKWAEEHGQIR